jgi:hypothetical protein
MDNNTLNILWEKGEVITYHLNPNINLEVLIDSETVRLTQAVITQLFERERTVITNISTTFLEKRN